MPCFLVQILKRKLPGDRTTKKIRKKEVLLSWLLGEYIIEGTILKYTLSIFKKKVNQRLYALRFLKEKHSYQPRFSSSLLLPY